MIEVRRADIDELALGDRGLLAHEIAALDEQGFVVVPSLLRTHEVERLLEDFEWLVADEPAEDVKELGTRRAVADGTDEVFEVCWRHRVALDAAAHLLGERFQVGNVALRDPKPGAGDQQLHPDYGSTPAIGLNATWFLDEFTVENGATRILPGTHGSATPPPGAYSLDPVPGEVVAVGPAGSVLLRHTYLFHAGGRNDTAGPRRAASAFFLHEIS